MFENGQMIYLGDKLKIKPMLGQIIFGTKCDRDKPIFFLQKEGVNKIELGIRKEPNGIRKCQTMG